MKAEVQTLHPAPGSSVRVRLVLPDDWNGRLVGLGGAGAGGAFDERALLAFASKGYAAAATDLGTAPDPRAAGFQNPEVWKDFGHRATHLMTALAKRRIRETYGREAKASYFVGRSTGGQQGLAEAQRHPEDYDGILAGVPAHCRTPLHAYFLWNYQHTRRPDGSPLFTKAQEASYRAAALEALSRRETFPHAKGRFLSDPRWSQDEREAVLRLAARRDPSLSPEHLAALRALQDGPVHARTGRRLFEGIPPAAKFAPACSGLFLFNWVFGPDVDFLAIDFDRDIDRYFALLSADLDAEDPDLDAFRARGGKIIAYSGTADSCVPYSATLSYYRRVAGRLGSPEAARDFFLYYILPGRDHLGGPGVQELYRPLDALRRWREKGIAPQLLGVSCTQGFKIPLKSE